MKVGPIQSSPDEKIDKSILQLVILLYEICRDILHDFIKEKFLKRYDDNFYKFLEQKKHVLYHSWMIDSKCCACKQEEVCVSPVRLIKPQFTVLFELVRNSECLATDILPNTDCICNIYPKDIALHNVEMNLLHCILMLSEEGSKEKRWMKLLYQQRSLVFRSKKNNKLEDYDSIWSKVEQTIWEIATESGGEPCLSVWKKYIKMYRQSEIGISEVKKYLDIMEIEFENLNAEEKEKAQKVVKPSDNSVEPGTDKLPTEYNWSRPVMIQIGDNNTIQNTYDQSGEVLETLQKLLKIISETNDFLLLHKKENVTFVVDVDRSHIRNRQASESNATGKSRYTIEWKLVSNELNYDEVEKIITAMKGFEITAGAIANIKFVRLGSVIIGTSVPYEIVENQSLFIKAVGIFLDKIVDKCNLHTRKACFIKVHVKVMSEDNIKIDTQTCSIDSDRHILFKERNQDDTLLNSILSRIRMIEKDIVNRNLGKNPSIDQDNRLLEVQQNQHEQKSKSVSDMSKEKLVNKDLCVKCKVKDTEIAKLKSEIEEQISKYRKHGQYGKMTRRTLSDSSIFEEVGETKHVYATVDDRDYFSHGKVRCLENYFHVDDSGTLFSMEKENEYTLLRKTGGWLEVVPNIPGATSFFVLSSHANVIKEDSGITPIPEKSPRIDTPNRQTSTFERNRSNVARVLAKKSKSCPPSIDKPFQGIIEVINFTDESKRKTQTKRFAKLKGSSLTIYKSPKKMPLSPTSKLEMEISLKGCSVEKRRSADGKDSLELKNQSGDNFVLQTESQDEAENLYLHLIRTINTQEYEEEMINYQLEYEESGGENTKSRFKIFRKPEYSTIIQMLTSFFRRRPHRESLEEKKILTTLVFGSDLKELCEKEKSKTCVPRFVAQCIAAIEKKDPNSNIYSVVPTNTTKVMQLRYQVEQDKHDLDSAEWDLSTLCGVLLLFFKELRSPLLPFSLCSIATAKDKQKSNLLRSEIQSLPKYNKETLRSLLDHFSRLIKNNGVEIADISKTFGTVLLWPEKDSRYDKKQIDCTDILEMCIRQKTYILD